MANWLAIFIPVRVNFHKSKPKKDLHLVSKNSTEGARVVNNSSML